MQHPDTSPLRWSRRFYLTALSDIADHLVAIQATRTEAQRYSAEEGWPMYRGDQYLGRFTVPPAVVRVAYRLALARCRAA